MTPAERHLDLTGDSKTILTMVVPNEILNGFKIAEFERVVGVPKSGFRAMSIAFQSEPNVAVNREQAIVLRNALSAVMVELTSEFQTRTGYELSEAAEVVLQLDAFIASQGVL
jgi:hypothetical protein